MKEWLKAGFMTVVCGDAAWFLHRVMATLQWLRSTQSLLYTAATGTPPRHDIVSTNARNKSQQLPPIFN